MHLRETLTITLALATLAVPALLLRAESAAPATPAAPAAVFAAATPDPAPPAGDTSSRPWRPSPAAADANPPRAADAATNPANTDLRVSFPTPAPRVAAVLLDRDAGYPERAPGFAIDGDAVTVSDVRGDVRGGWVVTVSGAVGRFGAPHRGTARGWWLPRRSTHTARLDQHLRPHLREMGGPGTASLQVGLTTSDGRPRWVTIACTKAATDAAVAFAIDHTVPLPHRVVLEGPDKYWRAVRIGG